MTTSTTSKSSTAYHHLHDRITSGQYQPGYRLVLSSIAAELDMSVLPVREAVRRLQAEGLVEMKRNVGAHVAMMDSRSYRYSMQALSVLEGAATALSARFLDALDLQRAHEINDQMVRTLKDFDPRSFTELNEEFHKALFSKCANPRLLELTEQEWTRLGNLRHSTFTFIPGRSAESVREHAHILQLIEGNAPLSDIERASRRHRVATLDAFMIQEDPDDHITLPNF